MDAKLKTLLFGLGAAAILFYLLKPSNGASGSTGAVDDDSQKNNALIALKAYKEAIQKGEGTEALEGLNKEIQREYGMRVIRKAADKSLAVVDSSGNQIIGTGKAA